MWCRLICATVLGVVVLGAAEARAWRWSTGFTSAAPGSIPRRITETRDGGTTVWATGPHSAGVTFAAEGTDARVLPLTPIQDRIRMPIDASPLGVIRAVTRTPRELRTVLETSDGDREVVVDRSSTELGDIQAVDIAMGHDG